MADGVSVYDLCDGCKEYRRLEWFRAAEIDRAGWVCGECRKHLSAANDAVKKQIDSVGSGVVGCLFVAAAGVILAAAYYLT